MIRSGGESRRRAVWYIQQIGADEAFPEAARLLIESDNYDDHRAVLNAMRAYGDRLEGAVPNWYLMLDKYISLDRPADVLIQCIELTALWKEHRLMPALTRLARHPDRDVRLAAFGGMARMANDLILPTLLKLYAADRSVYRAYALEGMERFPDSRLQRFIVEALADTSKSVRLLAVQALAAQADGEAQSHHLANQFQRDDDPEVRERIIQVIGERRWRRHSSVVARAVSDDSALVRAAALEAALLLQDSSLASAIARQQERENDGSLKLRSIYCLMRLESSGGGRGLQQLLTDSDVEVRRNAATALGYLRERSALSVLQQSALGDASAEVRLEAVGALLRLGDSRSIATLRELILRPEESPALKAAAIAAIAACGRYEARTALEQLAAEAGAGELRRRIQNALGQLRE